MSIYNAAKKGLNLGDNCQDEMMREYIDDSDDKAIIGSGGLLLSHKPHFNRYLRIAEKNTDKKLILFNVGATTTLTRKQEGRLRNLPWDLVIARDTVTQRYLKGLGLNCKLGSDPAFLAEPEEKGEENCYIFTTKPGTAPPYDYPEDVLDLYKKAFPKHRFLAMDNRFDRGEKLTWKKVLNLIDGVVVSNRLHPIIFALIKRVRCYPLSYKPIPILNDFRSVEENRQRVLKTIDWVNSL